MSIKKEIILLFACLSLFPISVFSQLVNQGTTLHNCGSDHLHQQQIDNEPSYAQAIAKAEKKIKAFYDGDQLLHAATTTYTIPVVVHVIHTGEAVGTDSNISDAQVNSAIEWLNYYYANADGSGTLNSDGVDIGFQFELASRTPDCSNTTGIVRVDGSSLTGYTSNGVNASGSSGVNDVTLKDISRWNPEMYLNIWVVNMIDGNAEGGTTGFAYFSSAGYGYQGIVVKRKAFGYDPTGTNGFDLYENTELNTTLAHEVGHYFDLYHTFEGDSSGSTCPDDTDCSSDGDKICDTDPHKRPTNYTDPFGAPYCFDASYGVESNDCVVGGTHQELAENLMNYVWEDCRNRFTSGQATRMVASLLTSRYGLLDGQALEAVPSSFPAAVSCSPSTSNLSTTTDIGIHEFTLGNYTYRSGTSIEDGGYLDLTCQQLNVSLNTDYAVYIENGVAYFEDVKIYIDYNDDGDFLDSGEEVFSSEYGKTHAGTLTISTSPGNVNVPLRMRVISDYFGSDINNACDNRLYGQVEDYSIIIDASPATSVSTTALSGFSSTSCCPSSDQTFTLSGTDLISDPQVSLGNTDFELSSDGTNYSNSLTLARSDNDLDGEPVTLYVRLKVGLSAGNYNDVLTISSTDASSQTISLSGSVAAILPVELLSFNGELEGNYVKLKWQTASERNNQGFEIQRLQADDVWENIGFVDGFGTSALYRNYVFYDKKPKAAINYYRLKQLDIDGKFEFSNIIAVNAESSLSENKIILFPNPTINHLSILNATGTALIYNAAGQSVKKLAIKDAIFSIDVSSFPTGKYFIHFFDQEGRKQIRSFIRSE